MLDPNDGRAIRAKQRADRIRDTVDIVDVLAHYGFRVRPDGGHREQQFSCDLHGTGQDQKPSARVYPHSHSWYCVSKDALILTDKGWRLLGESEDCPLTLDGMGFFQQPLRFLDRGVRPCITVRTTSGYQVTLTQDHEVGTVDHGWVQAGDLQPGEVLVSPCPRTPSFNSVLTLPCSVDDLNTRSFKGHPPLNLPNIWSLALGEALGYIFGDGWVTPRPKGSSGIVGITSSAEDADDARKVFRDLQVWSGGRGSEVHQTGQVRTPNGKVYTEDQYVFSVGNDGFCEWFQRMGLSKKGPPQDRRLPSTLWGAPREGIVGFLRGMYATDGSVFRPRGRKGIKVNLYSVSRGFLRDVQLLLLQLGVHSRLYPNATTRPGGVWYLQIATGKDILVFRQQVGIANNRKQAALDSYIYNPQGSRPHKVVVESVTPAGDLPVADLSMPGSPSFVANGIKVHNCFGCDKTRDAIETVRAKEGLDFWGAVKKLESVYGLAPLPVEEGYERPDPHAAIKEAMATLDPHKTFDDDLKELSQLLLALSEPPSQITMDRALAFWEAQDKVVFQVQGPKGEGGPWDERKGRAVIKKLRERVMEAMREGC